MITYNYDAYYRANLHRGSHPSPEQGLCLMELTALFAGEEHSDHPKCVSPVLGEFGRELNDLLPRGVRQELKALIPSLPGTAGDGMDEARSYMALDWLIHTWLPTWLDLLPGCREDARAIRELKRIVDLDSAAQAGLMVCRLKAKADIADPLPGVLPLFQVAEPTAWFTAGLATEAAAAGCAAEIAAWDDTWYAAELVTQVAPQELAPTIARLQRSAIQLYVDMIKDPR